MRKEEKKINGWTQLGKGLFYLGYTVEAYDFRLAESKSQTFPVNWPLSGKGLRGLKEMCGYRQSGYFNRIGQDIHYFVVF